MQLGGNDEQHNNAKSTGALLWFSASAKAKGWIG